MPAHCVGHRNRRQIQQRSGHIPAPPSSCASTCCPGHPPANSGPSPCFSLVGSSRPRGTSPSRHHWTWMYTPTPVHQMGRLPPSVKSWRTRPGSPLRGPQWPGLVAHPLGLLLTLRIWRLASIKTVHPSNFLGDHRLAQKKECEKKTSIKRFCFLSPNLFGLSESCGVSNQNRVTEQGRT